jgi:hypothetical protein
MALLSGKVALIFPEYWLSVAGHVAQNDPEYSIFCPEKA